MQWMSHPDTSIFFQDPYPYNDNIGHIANQMKTLSGRSRFRPKPDPLCLSREKKRRLHILKIFWIQSGPDPYLKNQIRPKLINPAESVTLDAGKQQQQ